MSNNLKTFRFQHGGEEYVAFREDVVTDMSRVIEEVTDMINARVEANASASLLQKMAVLVHEYDAMANTLSNMIDQVEGADDDQSGGMVH